MDAQELTSQVFHYAETIESLEARLGMAIALLDEYTCECPLDRHHAECFRQKIEWKIDEIKGIK